MLLGMMRVLIVLILSILLLCILYDPLLLPSCFLLLHSWMLNREKWIPHISCKRHLGWAFFLVQMGKYCIMKMEAALLSTSLHLPLLQLHQILTVQIQCLSTPYQNRQKLQVRSIAHLTILLLLLL